MSQVLHTKFLISHPHFPQISFLNVLIQTFSSGPLSKTVHIYLHFQKISQIFNQHCTFWVPPLFINVVILQRSQHFLTKIRHLKRPLALSKAELPAAQEVAGSIPGCRSSGNPELHSVPSWDLFFRVRMSVNVDRSTQNRKKVLMWISTLSVQAEHKHTKNHTI